MVPSYASVAGKPTPGWTRDPMTGDADLTSDGTFILRLRGSYNGVSAQDRVYRLGKRLDAILDDPSINASDVVVYAPGREAAPTIFIAGRRFVSVDAAAAAAADAAPKAVAMQWARHIQQLLPGLSARRVKASVVATPVLPALKVTDRLEDVGGSVGVVTYQNHVLLHVRGIQTGMVTSAEKADAIQERMDAALAKGDPREGADVQIQILPVREIGRSRVAPVRLIVNGMGVTDIDERMSSAMGYASPDELAQAWMHNIQTVIASIPVIITTPQSSVSTPSTTTDQGPSVPAKVPSEGAAL